MRNIAVKNISGVDQYISDMGNVKISANTTRTITTEYFEDFVLSSNDLYNLINNNNAVLVLENIEQTKTASLNFLLGTSIMSKDIVDALSNGYNLNSINPVASLSQVQAIGQCTNFSIWFGYNGQSNNKWLEIARSVPSSGTQVPVPANMTMTAVTFAASNSCGCNIEFYKNGITSGNLIYTYQVRNKMYSYTALTNGIQLAFGDRIACYSRLVSGQTTPSSPVVCFGFIVTSQGDGSGGA